MLCRKAGVSTADVRRNIPFTDNERAAVDDGQAAPDQLMERLTDVPTPAGPTPRQLGVSEYPQRRHCFPSSRSGTASSRRETTKSRSRPAVPQLKGEA